MSQTSVKPILLVMAAGLGSRYGGLKQVEPIGPDGETILEYSLFDARQAGFERAVIIINEEMEADFRQLLGDKASRYLDIQYACQDLRALPEGFVPPPGREKPWGTGHAVLCAAPLLNAPFCAVNADDYYGGTSFRLCYDHLSNLRDDSDFAMVGYLLKNTLSETGYVARGVCAIDENQFLTGIVERTHIIPSVDGPLMTEDMQTYQRLSPDTVVSMNMWGFPLAMTHHLQEAFPTFLNNASYSNPLTAEFFLPTAVDGMLGTGKARVTVHITQDAWYGITYQQDRLPVQAYFARMAKEGKYPRPLMV